jgi:pilus assembly protein CpaC
MSHVFPFCLILIVSVAAYGQEPGADPYVTAPDQQQSDPTGQRLQRLLQTAQELEQAGKLDQATAVRQQVERERQALHHRLDVSQPEIEQIRQVVGAGKQVIIRLQIAEVSLTKLQHMGFNLAQGAGDGDGKPIVDETSFNAEWSAITRDGKKAQQLLQSLRKENLAKILAEPTLVTTSGNPAVFNSGVELSVPKPQPDGSVRMERQYGTVVRFTPEALGDQVRLAIRGSLSELDYGHTVRVGKENVPGVQKREFDTRAELESGQTLAISGPIELRREVVVRGIPFIKDLPYVGAMFRSVEETLNKIALLILVRPEIVLPPAKPIRSASNGLPAETPATQAVPLNGPGDSPPAAVCRPMKTR